MTYPIFIPMHFGGGGRGPSSKKEALLLLSVYGAAISVFMYLLHINTSPRFQLKVIQKNNYSGQVYIRERNYPHIRKITNKNIECLKNKGYYVNEKVDKYSISSYWDNIAYLETINQSNRYLPKTIELSKEKLISNCKECDVYTEIIYDYDSIFGNEKQKKKKLYWHKYYKDELK